MTHKIYPHGLPKKLAENLWQVEGSLSIPLPRNMTIWRSPEGKLVLYSVVAMRDEGMRALEALGEPALMVIPHRRHQMDFTFYRERYPDIATGASKLIEYGIAAETIPGTSYEDLAMQLPIEGGHALCITELLGQMPQMKGVLGAALSLVGPPGGGFGVARAVKLREVRQAERTKDWMLERADDPNLKMIVTGHGHPVLENAQTLLREAALKGL